MQQDLERAREALKNVTYTLEQRTQIAQAWVAVANADTYDSFVSAFKFKSFS